MKKYFPFLLIIFFILTACSEEEHLDEGKINSDTISISNQQVIRDTNYRTKKIESVEDQINQLNRIIGINKSQLEKYETMITEGDTFELKGLPQYVEDLKIAIKLKEERLKKLKKK